MQTVAWLDGSVEGRRQETEMGTKEARGLKGEGGRDRALKSLRLVERIAEELIPRNVLPNHLHPTAQSTPHNMIKHYEGHSNGSVLAANSTGWALYTSIGGAQVGGQEPVDAGIGSATRILFWGELQEGHTSLPLPLPLPLPLSVLCLTDVPQRQRRPRLHRYAAAAASA